MKWKIDKGLDIPPVRYSTNNVYRELITDMEEGDSIGGLTQAQATGLAQLMRKHGIKAVSRKIGDSKDVAEPIYRVWHDGLLDLRQIRRELIQVFSNKPKPTKISTT